MNPPDKSKWSAPMWQAWYTKQPTAIKAMAAMEKAIQTGEMPNEYRARVRSHIKTAFGSRARVKKTKKKRGLL